MKRIIALLLAVMFVTGLCGAFAETDVNDELLSIALEMIGTVHELANDEVYVDIALVDDTERSFVAAVADSDPADLRKAYTVNTPIEIAALVAGVMGMSAPGRTKLAWEFINYPVLLNGDITGMILTWNRTCAEPDGFANCVWIVDCGGAVYFISFLETGGGAITASARPFMLGEGEDIESVIESMRTAMPLFVPKQVYPPED